MVSFFINKRTLSSKMKKYGETNSKDSYFLSWENQLCGVAIGFMGTIASGKLLLIFLAPYLIR